MSENTRQKHDRTMRTPDLLTQEEFDRDEDPQNELSSTVEERRYWEYQIEREKQEKGWRYRPHRSLPH